MTDTIAVLGGTGKEGKGLVLLWARAGRDVVIGSRDAERGRTVAAELSEATLRGTSNRDAAREGSIIVSTLPHPGHVELLQEIAPELEGKLLLTATIAWPPGPTSKPSAAEDLQEALGSAVNVVAAFQTVSAGTLRDLPDRHAEDVLVFGDDPDARERARLLVNETGLRGVHAGPLSQTRIAESITGLLLKINKLYGVKSTGIRITGMEDLS